MNGMIIPKKSSIEMKKGFIQLVLGLFEDIFNWISYIFNSIKSETREGGPDLHFFLKTMFRTRDVDFYIMHTYVCTPCEMVGCFSFPVIFQSWSRVYGHIRSHKKFHRTVYSIFPKGYASPYIQSCIHSC